MEDIEMIQQETNVGLTKRKMTIDHSSINDRDGNSLGGIQSGRRPSKDPRKSPKFGGGPFNNRASPLNFQVKKTMSKKNLRMSPSATSQKIKLLKSPSVDHQ